MNQVKIGAFIAQLRKEQELTQKQLAEQVGVSDKTISKWECGNGLPELSTIPELCKVLNINMNELLSGERLAEEVYSKKAEENMMTLMKETREQKRKNQVTSVTLLLSMFAVFAAIFLGSMFMLSEEHFSLWSLFDLATIFMILIPVILILLAAGHGKNFCKSFSMLSNKRNYTEEERMRCVRAVRLAANAALLLGVLNTVMSLIYLANYHMETGWRVEVVFANIAVAFLGILYGVFTYLLLLPVRSRLEMQLQA